MDETVHLQAFPRHTHDADHGYLPLPEVPENVYGSVGWRMNQDHRFLRMLKIEPCEILTTERAAEIAKECARSLSPEQVTTDSVPAYVYNAVVDAFVSLDAECQEAHLEAKAARNAYAVMYREFEHRSGLWKAATKDAARNRRAFQWASVIAAIATCAAWAGWLQ